MLPPDPPEKFVGNVRKWTTLWAYITTAVIFLPIALNGFSPIWLLAPAFISLGLSELSKPYARARYHSRLVQWTNYLWQWRGSIKVNDWVWWRNDIFSAQGVVTKIEGDLLTVRHLSGEEAHVRANLVYPLRHL